MISRGRQAVPHVVVHLVDYFNQAPWGVAGDPEKLWTVAELSAEFFNAFNIQNYGPPGATTTGVAGAGQVTSNVLPPRRDAVWSALRFLSCSAGPDVAVDPGFAVNDIVPLLPEACLCDGGSFQYER
jgi:hypothetical protein